jgi:hypothetical protein
MPGAGEPLPCPGPWDYSPQRPNAVSLAYNLTLNLFILVLKAVVGHGHKPLKDF